MSNTRRHGVVVLGGYITGLSAVRALASHGIPVAVVLTNPADIAHYSRWTSEYHQLFAFSTQPESLLELLEQQSQCWNGWVILPTCDEGMTILSRHHERLERWYHIAPPPWEVTRTLLQKDATYQIAQELGIDIAHVYGDAIPETAARADLVFPVVIKPVESRPFTLRFGMKLFVAHTRTELLRYIQDLQASGLRAQILDLVPGPDSQCHSYTVYLDRRGEPVAELPIRKLRQSPPFFGVTRLAEITQQTDLREPTIDLLRHIGWRGMAEAEYKLDPRDGRYRLMEVNGRCFLPLGLAQQAGVNYPLLAWQESVLGENVSAGSSGWDGVWVHLLDEIYYSTFFHRIERLRLAEYLAPYRRPKTYAVWSASDPKPFFAQCRQALKRIRVTGISSSDRAIRRSRVQDGPMESG